VVIYAVLLVFFNWAAVMFVRVKLKSDGIKRSVQIVESTRVKGQVKQRILRHVGVAFDDASEQTLKGFAQQQIPQLMAALSATQLQSDSFPLTAEAATKALQKCSGRRRQTRLADILPTSAVCLNDIQEESRIIEGIHEVIGPLFDELYGNVLCNKAPSELLKDIVLSRIVEPNSKRASQLLLQTHFGKTHDLDAVYRLMDDLMPRIARIKQQTFNKTRSLFPEGVDLILFDVTTLYFESTETDDLRRFGYSKDHRFNTTQVVLALATNAQGLPVGYELFEGNKAEVTTLVAAIESWKKLFSLNAVCFIGDRAMFTKANVALLEQQGYHYIIAAKLKALPQPLQQTLLDETQYKTTLLKNELAWIGEFYYETSRLIVSYKTKRARKDQRERQVVIDKIVKTIGAQGHPNKLVTNAGVKQYVSIDPQAKAQLDLTKIAKAAQWDGLHGLITNIPDATPESIIARYARLWVIEESFRINKHTLKMRPIYHRKPARIYSHIAICYMAFSLMRYLQHAMNPIETMSIGRIIDALAKVQASIHQHKLTGDRYRLPSAMNHDARKIYQAFGIHRSLDAEPYLV
jgi:transposase